ncbi:hypothetical protein K7I13_10650 [Brucepastera parasyntrophica]|uniref:hypothetical protein n=1 Tax=Brucepastera parasyntrophica TaxID=2880008 RepID=UPI00210E41E9|nr:hypothetical protein [Brucepastera parasyntrophica]ULQ58973.1 hypothetical protein K7I13_10650 [Brucepastera parasyntrophica]
MKNKKINTVLFIVAGTLVNLLFTFAYIALILFILSLLAPQLGPKITTFVPIGVLAGVFLGMITYQKFIKWVIPKFSLQDKMEPVFSAPKKAEKTENRDIFENNTEEK